MNRSQNSVPDEVRALANYRKGNLLILLALAAVIALSAKSLRAQTTNVFWDGDTNGTAGGTGSLNTGTARFSTNGPSVGGTLVSPNNFNYILNFGGTNGTVTQSSGTITNSGINWLTSGYTFSVGTSNSRTLLGSNNASMYITNNANLNISGVNSTSTLSGMNLTGGSGSTVTLSNAAGETFMLQFGTSSATSGRTNSVNTIVNGAGTIVLGTTGGSGFTQSGNITNNTSGSLLLLNGASGTNTISGNISGSGAVVLSNTTSTGIMLLSGVNSYSGGTTINFVSPGASGGYLGISDSSAFGSGIVNIAGAGTNWVRAMAGSVTITNAVSINNGSVYRLSASNSGWRMTHSGVISGAGAINFSSLDTQALSNTNNSFGGGVNIASSTTVLVNSIGNAGFNSSLGTNGTVTFSSSSGSGGAGEIYWLGSNSETSDKTFALTTVSSVATAGMKVFAGASSSGGTNVTLTLNGNINSTGATNLTVTLGAYNTNTLVMNGTINQTAGFTNSLVVGVTGQSGTVVLGNTNNSFGGAVTLNAGASSTNTLQVATFGNAGANSSLGTNAIINIGGSSSTGINILQYAGSGETSDKVINLAGTFGGATLDQSGSGNLKLSSAFTVTGAGAKTLTLQGSTAGTGELAAGLSDGGTNVISLVKNGSGTWILSGNNSYSGGTTISAGTLELGNSGSVAGNITNNATLSINRTDNSTLSNIVSGSGALTKSGSGTATLTGANSYTGGTTVNSGTLAYGANNVLANAGAVNVSGGTLDIGGFSDTVGTVTLTSGAITGSGGTLTGSSYAVQNGTISALLGGSGSLTKSTAGTVTISGTNNYTGAATISAGTLALNGVNNISGTVTINQASSVLRLASVNALTNGVLLGTGTTASTGTVELAVGGDYSLSAYGTSGTGGGHMAFTNSSGSAATLTFTGATNYVTPSSSSNAGRTVANNSTNLTLIFNGAVDIGSSGNNDITFNTAGNTLVKGVIFNTNTGVRGLTKSGAGTLILEGNNTYNGVTTISLGTIQVGNGGTSGTLGTNAVANSGVLVFNRSDAITASNAISGAGSVAQAGAGTLTLASSNSYSGGTTVNTGTLALGANEALGSGAVNVGGGALNIAGFSDTVGAVTLTSGSISGSGGTLTGSSYAVQSGTVSAILGGSGALTKSTAGTVTLSGANTYSGGTTVNAGTLALGSNDGLGSGAVNVSGGTLDIAGFSDTVGAVTLSSGAINGSSGTLTAASYALQSGTVSARLAGTGGLTKTTASTVTLTGDSSYSGNTAVSSGILEMNGVHSGAGNVTVTNAAVLRLGKTNSLANGVLVGGASSGNTGTVELTAGGNYAINAYGSSSASAGYMNFTNSSGSAATLAFTAATNVITSGNNGGRVVANLSTNLSLIFNGAVDISSTANNDVTFNTVGDISIQGGVLNNSNGIRSLTKAGAGTLTLAGNSTYNGLTDITAGTLVTSGNENLADATSVSIASNSIFRLGGNETVAAVSAVSTAGLNLQAYTLTVGGTGSSFTNTASITGTGGIVKNGAGLIYLNNAGNTFSGGFTLNAGEAAFTASGAYGSGVVTNSVFGTGTLTLNGGILRSSSDTSSRNIANSTILGGNVQLGKTGAAATLTFNNAGGGTTTLATNLTLTTVADVDYLQAISGAAFRITKEGAGELYLEASNNIAGIDLSAGALTYRNRNSFGTGLLTLAEGVAMGQSGSINNPNTTGNDRLDRALANAMRLDGNVTFGGFGNASYFGGNIDLNGANRTVTLGNTTHLLGSVTNGGLVVDNGAVDGTSRTLNLMASNSYAGGTVVRTNAALAVGNDNALGTGSVVFTNTSGSGKTATLRVSTLSTDSQQLRTITNAIGLASGVDVKLDSVTTAQNGSGSDVAVNVDTVLSGSISGLGGLTKIATNKVTLRGVNSYAGTTTVNAGTLEVASGGSISSSAATVNTNAILTVNGTAGDVTVNSGGKLMGSGSVGALEIASGGTLAVGNSPGTLTAASAIWNGGGIYSWELASAAGNDSSFLTGRGSQWDFLNVSGVLDITASSGNEFIIDIISLLALNDTTFNQNSNYSFAIATAAGGISNFDASDFTITGFLASSGNWSLGLSNNTGSSQSLVLAYTGATAIPEPSTGALLLIGLTGALLARPNRRKS